jgi:SAM-dependent methyltransferase
VFCLDVNISNFKYISKKIKVFGLDATKENSVKNFLKKINISYNQEYFDIIIDDGSHKQDDILNALKLFFRSLKPNGFYIIEDYKHMNFIKHLRVINELKIDKIINFLKIKKLFKSRILKSSFQKELFKRIKDIKYYKGSSKISNIVFFKKN